MKTIRKITKIEKILGEKRRERNRVSRVTGRRKLYKLNVEIFSVAVFDVLLH